MGNFKLYYFNMMGRAEVIRFLFAQAGVDYEDIRIQKDDWPQYKSKMPNGQMPVLEEDGRMLSQSTAIALYLAKKFDLNGENDWEAAKVLESFCCANDLADGAVVLFKGCDETERKKFETEKLQPYFARLDHALKENGTGFFVGKKLTVVDLNMLCMIGLFGSMFPDTAAKHPKLIAFKDKIVALPGIKKHIETRPKTDC